MPSQAYALGVQQGDWQDEPAQHVALQELDRIQSDVLQSVRSGEVDFGVVIDPQGREARAAAARASVESLSLDSLARQLIAAHDGTLEIVSRKGAGTTATIRLP